MDENKAVDVRFSGELIAVGSLQAGMVRRTLYNVECLGPDGRVKWADRFYNAVVTDGLNDSLDKHFKGSTYTAAWFVGLTGSTPAFAAGDTMASHAGWAEDTTYTEAARQALTLGAVSGGSVSNSSNKAAYSINNTATIGGAFVTTGSVKGTGGSTGVLYGGGAFTGGNRAVQNGDTLNITVTLTAGSA